MSNRQERQRKLALKMRDGTATIYDINELTKSFEHLLRKEAGRWTKDSPTFGFEDAMQAAREGMIKGLMAYDPKRGAPSTVVTIWVRERLRYEHAQSGHDGIRRPTKDWKARPWDQGEHTRISGEKGARAVDTMRDPDTPEEIVADEESLRTLHERINEHLATLDPVDARLLAAAIQAPWCNESVGQVARSLGKDRRWGYAVAEVLRKDLAAKMRAQDALADREKQERGN